MPAPKKYPDELMDRGVRLVFESGRPIAHVARDLGVPAVCYGPQPTLSAGVQELEKILGAAVVDRGRRQSFVHWHEKITGTQDAPSAAERCVDRFTECNSNIFDRVMLIHVEVARCSEPQVETTVTRHQFKHVIEEKNPCGNFGLAVAIKIQAQVDLRFLRVAAYLCASRHQRA